MADLVEIAQGDEVVISRRRFVPDKDDEGKEITRVEVTEISAVRCPENCVLGGTGGTLQPELVPDPKDEARDRRFLVARFPMRY